MSRIRRAKRTEIVPTIKLSQCNSLDVIGQHYEALLRDALRIFKGRYSCADYTRDAATVKWRLHVEGITFATKRLPDLATAMFRSLETGCTSLPQFSKKRGTEHPAFLGRLFSLVFCNPDENLRTEGLNFLYNFLVSFKKLKGDYPQKVIRKFFSGFVKVDRDLARIDFHAKELRPVLEDVRQQFLHFVEVTDLLGLIEASTPQPGPGATNRPTEKHMRYRPHVRYNQIERVFQYEDWFYPNWYYAFISDGVHNGLYNFTVNSPMARFKAVPKTYGKPRGVCIEENEMQVFQQLVRKAFYKAIELYFGDKIALRKQSVNAELALNSSASGTHATIDESEASDRIARELVKNATSLVPKIWTILDALASKYVIPPIEVKDEFPDPIKLNKFAPMGSALCFPVMSLIHMFLIKAIIRAHCSSFTTHDLNEIYVYGDDIILPVKYTELVYRELPKYGMKLNTDKSFYRSKFRESCGVHAYNGVDITPVYVKHVPNHNLSDAKASVFAVESQLFKKGLYNAAKLHRDLIRTAYGEYPYVPEGLSLAGFVRPPTGDVLRELKKQAQVGVRKRFMSSVYKVKRFLKRSAMGTLPHSIDAYTRWLWTGSDNSCKIGDSVEDLIEVETVVLESALGSKCTSDFVEELATSRYPTCGGRYTHPSWFGRLQKNKVAVGARCYL